MAVVFLEDVELLRAAIEIGADVVPGIGEVVFFEVGVGVAEVAEGDSCLEFSSPNGTALGEREGLHFSRVGMDIGEGIEDVGQDVGGEILGLEIAAVDCPVSASESDRLDRLMVRDAPTDKVGNIFVSID